MKTADFYVNLLATMPEGASIVSDGEMQGIMNAAGEIADGVWATYEQGQFFAEMVRFDSIVTIEVRGFTPLGQEPTTHPELYNSSHFNAHSMPAKGCGGGGTGSVFDLFPHRHAVYAINADTDPAGVWAVWGVLAQALGESIIG